MNINKKVTKIAIAIAIIILCTTLTVFGISNLSTPTEINSLKSLDNPANLYTFERVNVEDLSSLNGQSFAIAGLNGNLKNVGIVVNGRYVNGTKTGLNSSTNGVLDITNNLIYTDEVNEVTFENGVATSDGYLYELHTSEGKYVKINGSDVSLSDEPVQLLVRKNQIATYSGEIVISDTNKTWCLNWSGGDKTTNARFGSYNAVDKNSHITLLKKIDDTSIEKGYIFHLVKDYDVNELDGREFYIIQTTKGSMLSNIVSRQQSLEPIIHGTIVSPVSSDGTAYYYLGYDEFMPKYKFESVEENSNKYYVSTIDNTGAKKYININDGTNRTLTFSDNPQVIIVYKNSSNRVCLTLENLDETGYPTVQMDSSTLNFYSQKNKSLSYTLGLFESEKLEGIQICYDVTATQGDFHNSPIIESEKQIIVDNTESLYDVSNEDQYGYFNITHDVSKYAIHTEIEDYYNDTKIFKDTAENASKTWGFQMEFLNWKSTDVDGKECYFNVNEPIRTDGDYIYIIDINGQERKMYNHCFMKANYRERSSVGLFFLNYNGLIMDGDGTIQNWPEEDFTPLLAVAHVYNADKMLVGTDDVYADEIHQLLTSRFRTSYDPNDSGLQIVIENILDIDPNNTSRLNSYEIKTGIDAEELKSDILRYLRNENINIKLSSLHNPRPTASIENMNAKNYDIRWYVLKTTGRSYHIDGVVIAKTERVDVRKNVYNLTENEESTLMDFNEIDNQVQNYYINVSLLKSTGIESYFNLVTSNDYEEAKQGYYTYHDNDNGNYEWNTELINEEPYILEERNFKVPGKDCAITIDVNFSDGSYERLLKNQVNTANVKGLIAGSTIDSIEFNNYYTNEGCGVLYLNKIDKDTNLGIENAVFRLINEETGESFDSKSDARGVAYVVDMPVGTYKLVELTAPNGYIKSIYDYDFVVERTEDNTLVKSVSKSGETKLLYSQKEGIIIPFVVENRKDNNTFVIEKEFKGLTTSQIDSLEDYKITLDNGINTYELKLDDDNVEIYGDGKSYVWYIDNFNYGTYTLTESGYNIRRYNVLPKLIQRNTEVANTTQDDAIVYNLDLLTKDDCVVQLENTYSEITNFNYRVEYYYDGILDESKTDTYPAQYGDVITDYQDKVIPGYKLEREVDPIQITENEDLNVMKVYYVPDDTSTKTIKYIVKYYKDGQEVYEDRIVRTDTVQLLDDDILNVVSGDVNNVDKYVGYSFETMDLNGQTITTVPQTVQDKDVINVYYTKNQYRYTVEYYYDGVLDESKTDEFSANYKDRISSYEDKVIPGYKLEKPVKPIVISENPEDNVMKVYYILDENSVKIIRYTVRYYKDGMEVEEDKIVRTDTVQVLQPNTLDIVAEDINIIDKYEHYDFYKIYLNKEVIDTVPTIAEDKDVIDIYYVKKDCKYTVEYYYDGVLDESKTDEFNAKYGDEITTYKDKVIPGYKLERQVQPIQIVEDSSQNVMRVYYVTDPNSTKDIKYTVRYFKDDVEVPLDKIVRTKTIQSLQPSTLEVVSGDINIVDKYTGYEFEKLELNSNQIQEIPQIANNKDVFDVYYVSKTYKYKVEYYYDGVLDESKTDEFSAKYQEIITEYTDKVIDGYKLAGEVRPIQITENEEENVMKVYYVPDEDNTKDIKYTVRYFKDGQEQVIDKIVRTNTVQILQPDTLEVVSGDINIVDKYTGYKFEKMELNESSIITVPEIANNNDVIDVYYVKEDYKYRVEYYYDGVLDESKTDEFSAKYQEIITEYTDKVIDGYKLAGEVRPIQITENEEENVMRVYYITDEGNTKDIKYTVRYFKDGQEQVTDKIVRTNTVQILQPDTLEVVSGDINIVDKYTGYKFEKMELNESAITTIPEIVNNNDVIDVYYVKEDYKYRVEYYYDGVLDESKTDEFSAKYDSVITEYEDKVITGYRLQQEVTPIRITQNEEENVMRVYYIKDSHDTKDIYYKVKYFKDGVEVVEDEIIRGKTVQVLDPDTLEVNKDEINITDKYAGYDFSKLELNETQIDDIPDEVADKDVIKVYYERKPSKIIVRFEDRNGVELQNHLIYTAKVGDILDLDEIDDTIESYTLYSKTHEGLIEYKEEEQIVIFVYDKNAKVVVRYVDIDTQLDIDEEANYEINGVIGYSYSTLKKSFTNYEFVESTNNTSGKMNEELTEVVYYYRSTQPDIPVDPDPKDDPTPVDPDNPVTPNNPQKDTTVDTSDINFIAFVAMLLLSIFGIKKSVLVFKNNKK